MTPLMIAARKNHDMVVRVLVGEGADINKINRISGDTALHLAVMNNACDSMRILLKDPEIDYDKKNPINLRTPMHVALLHENLFAYRMLAAKQAEIETNTF